MNLSFPQGVETDPHLALTLPPDAKPTKAKVEDPVAPPTSEELSIRIGRGSAQSGKPPFIRPSSAISAKADHILEASRKANHKTLFSTKAVL